MYLEKTYVIRIIQKSTFPRRLPLEYLLLKGMKTGADRGWYTSRDKRNEDGFTAYLEHAIGRGIKVLYHLDELEEITLAITLPAGLDEIHAFCEMAKRVKQLWTSSVLLNEEVILESRLYELEDELRKENEQILNNMITCLLNGQEQMVVLKCAMYRLMMGIHEAEMMIPENLSISFGTWMNTLQERVYYIPEPEIIERRDDLSIIAIYTIPENVPVVFPTKSVPPERFYSDALKSYTIHFDEVFIKPYFTTRIELPEMIERESFLRYIPVEFIHYFDAGNVWIEAISVEQFIGVKKEIL